MATIKIEDGKAMEIIRELDQQHEAQKEEAKRLRNMMRELEVSGAVLASKLMEQLVEELGIEQDELHGIDLNYLEQHGLAFVRVKGGECECPLCQDEDDSQFSNINQLMTEH